MATIKEVAERASVSSATVSRVLNGDARVSAKNSERVRAAIEELGYRPNRIARSLRRQTSETLGVVISDIENPHFTRAVRSIEDDAYRRGYRVVLCNTDETPQKQRDYLEVLAAEQVVGVILAPADPADLTISALIDMHIPVVAFDRSVNDERADAVLADNARATYQATQHLLELGREQVGFIGGRAEIQTGTDRMRGYEQAVNEAGQVCIVSHGEFRIDTAREATLDLLHRYPETDGLVVANNLMAIGALQALRRSGRQIPDDVAVVGIDDPPWAELVGPAMTTLAQPTAQMARAAFELLVDRISGRRSQARFMIFNFELIIRESCGSALAGSKVSVEDKDSQPSESMQPTAVAGGKG